MAVPFNGSFESTSFNYVFGPDSLEKINSFPEITDPTRLHDLATSMLRTIALLAPIPLDIAPINKDQMIQTLSSLATLLETRALYFKGLETKTPAS